MKRLPFFLSFFLEIIPYFSHSSFLLTLTLFSFLIFLLVSMFFHIFPPFLRLSPGFLSFMKPYFFSSPFHFYLFPHSSSFLLSLMHSFCHPPLILLSSPSLVFLHFLSSLLTFLPASPPSLLSYTFLLQSSTFLLFPVSGVSLSFHISLVSFVFYFDFFLA